MRLIGIGLCCLCYGFSLQATGYFEYSAQARKVYDRIFSLRFQEARQEMVLLQLGEPGNLILHSLANYLDCMTIFIGEQTETYEKLSAQKEKRLEMLKSGDLHSPYYLYTQADIHLQWAITRVKFEDYFQAVMEIKRAYSLLTRNQRLFPDFKANLKNLGILHALVGTVPDQYRWGVKLLGMSGTIAQGRGEIEEVLAHARRFDFVFRDEVYVMYAYLLLHLENKGEEAWKMIQSSSIDAEKNPLACFVKANIAMQTGRNDEAIRLLEKKPDGSEYFPFPYLHFMEGMARLNRLEPGADGYLWRFLRETKGRHYIKEAYQKLAWYEQVSGRPEGYFRYMQACKSLGHAVVDEDLTALQEARKNVLPDRQLLQARILFDGGYYEKAKKILQQVSPDQGDLVKQTEYHYRLGRVHQQLGHFEPALSHFQKTIDLARFEGSYFACNAALMSGRLYEERGNFIKAKEYYLMVLNMQPDEYRSSLHQKAKAGLNRLEETN